MEIISNKFFIAIGCAFAAFIITYLLIPVIIRVSHVKHLCDVPSVNRRKVHIHSIPTLGGLAIFGAVIITFFLSGYAVQPWVPYLSAGLIVLLFSGLKDDILETSPFIKLFLQITAGVFLMWGSDMVITDLGGVFGFNEIPYWAGAILTLFTIVVVINAYNLIDGIDGLAGGVGVIASAFFAWCFWQAGLISYAILAIILTGSLAGFLWHNFNPASIFMGDTGSQIVGLFIAFFGIIFVKTSGQTADLIPFRHIAPVLVLAVLIVPLYDTLRVFLVRVARKKSPFKPDRSHIHHQLLDMGFSQKATLCIILFFNLTIVAIPIVFQWLNINILLGMVVLSATVLYPTVHIKRRLLIMLGVDFIDTRESNIIYGPKRKEEQKRVAV